LEKVSCGFTEMKPGWVRVSIHPTTSNQEMEYVCDCLIALADHALEWKKEYLLEKGHYRHVSEKISEGIPLNDQWFEV